MADNYGYPEKRKTKKDKYKKKKNNPYKKGGRYRATNVSESPKKRE